MPPLWSDCTSRAKRFAVASTDCIFNAKRIRHGLFTASTVYNRPCTVNQDFQGNISWSFLLKRNALVSRLWWVWIFEDPKRPKLMNVLISKTTCRNVCYTRELIWSYFQLEENMSNVVATNTPSVAVPGAPTLHPASNYAKTYKNVGVRHFGLVVLHFCTLMHIFSINIKEYLWYWSVF